MSQLLSTSYSTYRWLRITTGLGLLLCGILLAVSFGGFPPEAWRFLVMVLATLPTLTSIRGMAIVLPFVGLLLQSFLILVCWLAWMYACVRFVRYEWKMARHTQEMDDDDEEPELDQEQELPAFVPPSSIPTSPVEVSEYDTLPDTVYPRMPSSARRYPIPSALVNKPVVGASSSRIPARASAQLVAVRVPVPQDETHGLDTTTYFDDEGDEGYDDYKYEEAPTRELDSNNKELEEQLADGIGREGAQIRLIVGIGSDAGCVPSKAVNEDNVLGLQNKRVTGTGVVPVGLFVVADGMGGHADGQEASRLATCSVSEVVTPRLLSPGVEEAQCEELLKDGVQYANFTIYQHNQQNFMMGTTITTALVFGSTAYLANVGDSRTYLYREGEGLARITTDHSRVWQLVQEGKIKPEDIYTHPKRNEITRCLGESVRVEVDTFKVPLQVDDVLLLCSDGLWEMVRDAEIAQIIQDNTPRASEISAKLIEAALRNGGADNVSVIAVCVTKY